MAINKVIYGANTLIDLTGDNVTVNDVVKDKIFHLPNGIQSTGSLVVQKFYTGSATPSSSLGNDGDLYLKV